jgi:hypothetical protein
MKMATGRGSKKFMGAGSQGKRDGSGAMTTLPDNFVPENAILSNRDKKQHSHQRGLDSKAIQTEQHQDHAANRYPDESDGST